MKGGKRLHDEWPRTLSYDAFVRLIGIERHALSNYVQLASGWLQMGNVERGLQAIQDLGHYFQQDARLRRVVSADVYVAIFVTNCLAETHGLKLQLDMQSEMTSYSWPTEINRYFLPLMTELVEQLSAHDFQDALHVHIGQSPTEFIWRLTLDANIACHELAARLSNFSLLNKAMLVIGGTLTLCSWNYDEESAQKTTLEMRWPRKHAVD